MALAASLSLLAACVGTASKPENPAHRPADSTQARIAAAATAPLNDLNLVRAPIPAVLVAAQKAPYAAPASPGCPALVAEVQALDAKLGPDLDVIATAGDPGLVERGADFVGEETVGAVRSTAEGVLPFRSWVRRLTGAQRYSREVAAAIAAGTVRRAYLKGLGESLGCAPPAAPRGSKEQ
jgi:hypothetical protein